MTREMSTKILKQLAQRAYSGETITPTLLEVEALFDGVKALEKPPAQPLYITDDGKIIPLPEPQALPLPEDWKAGAELCRMINANIDARIKHFLELERERKGGREE